MDDCSKSAESADGRTVFAITPSGQLKMPRLGNYCVTMLGDGASDVDVARGANFASTSSDSLHGPKSVGDGDAQSYWASAVDPSAPVDVQVYFGSPRQIKSIDISWEHPAQVHPERSALRALFLLMTLPASSQRSSNQGVRIAGCAGRQVDKHIFNIQQ